MSNHLGVVKANTENLSRFPNVNSLLKLSLGLVLFTIVSTALVYAETLSVDDSSKSTPSCECGPGTVLKNNICELDDRCGPGTILVNGECVIEPTSEPSSSSKVIGKELIKGIVCAFVISGIVAIFLGIIAKARKKIN